MYEIRKWVIKPVLNEVIYSNLNFQALEEILGELSDNMSEKEFFDLYEIEELETGLKNNEVLCSI
ncbi:MAG: hypothetical protein IJH12_01880 [Clostridia bacterium]|nr:hypothetical protein [Clostridia bacterium]